MYLEMIVTLALSLNLGMARNLAMTNNKRPMGHIAHLRKQLNKHIWLYHNIDLEKKKNHY